MKFYQQWTGSCLEEEIKFPASVPGNIQLDYGNFKGWGDINYGAECEKYRAVEDYTWYYTANADYKIEDGERLYFVSKGIDYIFDIIINDEVIHSQEGMFTPVELDITDYVKLGGEIKVKIYPHPKRPCEREDRREADESVKPAVCYDWDWHPRLLVSGIWEETYLETRKSDYITHCTVNYELSEDYSYADVTFDTTPNVIIELISPDGEVIYNGNADTIRVERPQLWWCNGQGNPSLYTWIAKTSSDEKTGRIGFRRVKLVMNEGTWNEPPEYPMSRSNPPATIQLNGRIIFAKGSNFVNPEVFVGTINEETYKPLVEAAKECNMNIFRCWGGAIVGKQSFFDLCDENGIMVWQEFPLACNQYKDIPDYLKTLKQEAISIIKAVKPHPCHVLWCGGNELFNNWSLMTDQSLALRLLDKLCYEHDITKPYIMTSPLSGMAHGPYAFYVRSETKTKSVYDAFNNSHYTTYTEFGVRAFAEYNRIQKYLPHINADNIMTDEIAAIHKREDYAYTDILLAWGETGDLKTLCERSQILQAEGLKAIYEEARRQKPYCSMAVNWCYNEPWFNTTNHGVLSYPANKKECFYTIKESLKGVTLAARFKKFCWKDSRRVTFDLWLLNDTYERVEDVAKVYLVADGKRWLIHTWYTGLSEINRNIKGPEVSFILPQGDADMFKIVLVSEKGYDNEYRLIREDLNSVKRYGLTCTLHRRLYSEARELNAALEDGEEI